MLYTIIRQIYLSPVCNCVFFYTARRRGLKYMTLWGQLRHFCNGVSPACCAWSYRHSLKYYTDCDTSINYSYNSLAVFCGLCWSPRDIYHRNLHLFMLAVITKQEHTALPVAAFDIFIIWYIFWHCPQTSSFYTLLPAYEDGTECSETSVYKFQTPGNHPKESIQHLLTYSRRC